MRLRFGKENCQNTFRVKIIWRPSIQWVRKNFSHHVRACELETGYEFIICEGINDGKKSVDSVSVILGGEGSWLWTSSLNSFCSRHQIKDTNRRQLGEGWQWVKAEIWRKFKREKAMYCWLWWDNEIFNSINFKHYEQIIHQNLTITI